MIGIEKNNFPLCHATIQRILMNLIAPLAKYSSLFLTLPLTMLASQF